MKIGYARVSTRYQNLDLQTQALKAEGCAVIFTDRASGASTVRKGLARAMARCHEGDELVVWRLDRLGRDLLDLLRPHQTLLERGASLTILTGLASALDMGCAEGRTIFTMLAALAEYERALLGERINAGLDAARKRSPRLGRPRRKVGSTALSLAWHNAQRTDRPNWRRAMREGLTRR